MLDLKDFVNLTSATVQKDADLDACFKLLLPLELDFLVAMSFSALQWILNRGFHVSTIVENYAGLDSRIVALLNFHWQQVRGIHLRASVRLPDLSEANMSNVSTISLTGIEDPSHVERVVSACSLRSVTVDGRTAAKFLEALALFPARLERLYIQNESTGFDVLYPALEQVRTSLRDLSFTSWSVPPTCEHLRKICAACPNLTSLHFDGLRTAIVLLSEEDLGAVSRCPNLVTLSLPGFVASGVSGFDEVVRRCPRLQCVRFSQPFTMDQLQVFAAHGTALEQLQFTVPVQDPVGLRILFAGLQVLEVQPAFLAAGVTAVAAIGFMSQLRRVSMHTPNHTAHPPVDFGAVVHAIAQHCPLLQVFVTGSTFMRGTPNTELNTALTALFNGCRQLTEFRLSGSRDRVYAWQFEDGTLNAVPPTLRVLVLADFQCSGEALVHLVSNCKQLREVTFSPHSPGAVTEDLVLALAEHCPYLQQVCIYGKHCAVTAPAVLKLAQRCRKLTRLYIPSRVLNAVDAALRAEERMHKLTVFAPHQTGSTGDES
jgi:hypothetical protein